MRHDPPHAYVTGAITADEAARSFEAARRAADAVAEQLIAEEKRGAEAEARKKRAASARRHRRYLAKTAEKAAAAGAVDPLPTCPLPVYLRPGYMPPPQTPAALGEPSSSSLPAYLLPGYIPPVRQDPMPGPPPPCAEVDECAICMDERRSCAFYPCGHVCACRACSELLSTDAVAGGNDLLCPVCREKVVGFIQVVTVSTVGGSI